MFHFKIRQFPPGIGPHQGKEFELMKAGKKHVALFTDYDPPGLDDFLSSPDHGVKETMLYSKSKPFKRRIVFRVSCEGPAHEIQEILRTYGRKRRFDPALERRIGQILSYSERDITAWLRRSAILRARRPKPHRTRARRS